jgi:hypothetical protein
MAAAFQPPGITVPPVPDRFRGTTAAPGLKRARRGCPREYCRASQRSRGGGYVRYGPDPGFH